MPEVGCVWEHERQCWVRGVKMQEASVRGMQPQQWS